MKYTSIAKHLLAAILLTSGVLPCRAAVSFTFDFTDASGVGFNAAGQTGADRRAALQRAGDYVSSFFINYNANIVMSVNGSQTGTTTLASASSAFNATPDGPGFGDQGDVMRKILGGNAADPDPSAADGTVNWNFSGFQWATGDTFLPGELDMVSTGIHEITHALGFASGILQSGQDYFETTIGLPSIWAPFDQFVGNSSGALIDSSFELNSAGWNAASAGGTGAAGLYFLGANAVAANGGNPVFLYSPTSWLDGSSGSHLDTDFYDGTGGNELNMMNHEGTVAEGLDIRDWNAIEIGMLRDLGYTNIIPEPSAFLMGILGTGCLVLRRRRSCSLVE